ncbi:DUF4212 domain-containing protein [bacterium]|nr:DUF4212 domain-containing protein [bacterium]
MAKNESFEVNFFKPLSDHAKANKKLILTLATIWAVCVFGFQFLLMALNKPTPEKNYDAFLAAWPQVVDNQDTEPAAKADFARVLLSVLGKNIALREDHKAAVSKTLSWTLFTMQSDSGKAVFQKEPDEETRNAAIASLGLETSGFDKIMIDLLPASLKKVDGPLDDQTRESLPGIMKLYLVHNQNALTDFRFLGFPFHYWYTAQFLLIMFVILCLIYALMIDRMNVKHDFVEET